MPGFFDRVFGGNSQPGSSAAPNGGIEHRGNGSVQQLQTANPQDNLGGNNPNNNQGGGQGSGGNPSNPGDKKDDIFSRLDSMAPLWQTPTDANGKPIQPQQDPLRSQVFSFDPAKVKEQVDKLDFTTNLNQEQLEKIVGQGGDVTALREVLNTMARTVFMGSSMNAGSLINDGFTKFGGQIDQALPGRVRALQVASSKSDNPILSHPAVAPMAKSISQLISQRAPHASADEISKATEEFFDAIGAAYTAKTDGERTQAAQKVEDNIDWLKTMKLG